MEMTARLIFIAENVFSTDFQVDQNQTKTVVAPAEDEASVRTWQWLGGDPASALFGAPPYQPPPRSGGSRKPVIHCSSYEQHNACNGLLFTNILLYFYLITQTSDSVRSIFTGIYVVNFKWYSFPQGFKACYEVEIFYKPYPGSFKRTKTSKYFITNKQI